jgi:protein required for attachment to host cells
MDTTWIVVADAGRARIFSESDASQPLQEVEDMVHSASRLRTSDQYTDRLGPTAAGQSSHSTGGALPNKQYEPQQTMEEREAELFAKDISGFLLKGHQDRKFQKIRLIAAPKFLGALRMFIDPQLKPLVTQEVNKDYTHLSGHQLREQMQSLNSKQ